ncbi:MAG: hypothetical protein ACI9HK_001712 [Pirellulaceae bacterium]|jgi:hypothetical protein
MPPRFPKPVAYNNIAGRRYLTKKELNALYFATHELRRPRSWTNCVAVGRYWRAALVVFFNYGLDTGVVWGTTPAHEPILWRHVCGSRHAPNRLLKEQSRWGPCRLRRFRPSDRRETKAIMSWKERGIFPKTAAARYLVRRAFAVIRSLPLPAIRLQAILTSLGAFARPEDFVRRSLYNRVHENDHSLRDRLVISHRHFVSCMADARKQSFGR